MASDTSHCRTGQDCGHLSLLVYHKEAQIEWDTSERETKVNWISSPNIMITASIQILDQLQDEEKRGRGAGILELTQFKSRIKQVYQCLGKSLCECVHVHTRAHNLTKGARKSNREWESEGGSRSGWWQKIFLHGHLVKWTLNNSNLYLFIANIDLSLMFIVWYWFYFTFFAVSV